MRPTEEQWRRAIKISKQPGRLGASDNDVIRKAIDIGLDALEDTRVR